MSTSERHKKLQEALLRLIEARELVGEVAVDVKPADEAFLYDAAYDSLALIRCSQGRLRYALVGAL